MFPQTVSDDSINNISNLHHDIKVMDYCGGWLAQRYVKPLPLNKILEYIVICAPYAANNKKARECLGALAGNIVQNHTVFSKRNSGIDWEALSEMSCCEPEHLSNYENLRMLVSMAYETPQIMQEFDYIAKFAQLSLDNCLYRQEEKITSHISSLYHYVMVYGHVYSMSSEIEAFDLPSFNSHWNRNIDEVCDQYKIFGVTPSSIVCDKILGKAHVILSLARLGEAIKNLSSSGFDSFFDNRYVEKIRNMRNVIFHPEHDENWVLIENLINNKKSSDQLDIEYLTHNTYLENFIHSYFVLWQSYWNCAGRNIDWAYLYNYTFVDKQRNRLYTEVQKKQSAFYTSFRVQADHAINILIDLNSKLPNTILRREELLKTIAKTIDTLRDDTGMKLSLYCHDLPLIDLIEIYLHDVFKEWRRELSTQKKLGYPLEIYKKILHDSKKYDMTRDSFEQRIEKAQFVLSRLAKELPPSFREKAQLQTTIREAIAVFGDASGEKLRQCSKSLPLESLIQVCLKRSFKEWKESLSRNRMLGYPIETYKTLPVNCQVDLRCIWAKLMERSSRKTGALIANPELVQNALQKLQIKPLPQEDFELMERCLEKVQANEPLLYAKYKNAFIRQKFYQKIYSALICMEDVEELLSLFEQYEEGYKRENPLKEFGIDENISKAKLICDGARHKEIYDKDFIKEWAYAKKIILFADLLNLRKEMRKVSKRIEKHTYEFEAAIYSREFLSFFSSVEYHADGDSLVKSSVHYNEGILQAYPHVMSKLTSDLTSIEEKFHNKIQEIIAVETVARKALATQHSKFTVKLLPRLIYAIERALKYKDEIVSSSPIAYQMNLLMPFRCTFEFFTMIAGSIVRACIGEGTKYGKNSVFIQRAESCVIERDHQESNLLLKNDSTLYNLLRTIQKWRGEIAHIGKSRSGYFDRIDMNFYWKAPRVLEQCLAPLKKLLGEYRKETNVKLRPKSPASVLSTTQLPPRVETIETYMLDRDVLDNPLTPLIVYDDLIDDMTSVAQINRSILISERQQKLERDLIRAKAIRNAVKKEIVKRDRTDPVITKLKHIQTISDGNCAFNAVALGLLFPKLKANDLFTDNEEFRRVFAEVFCIDSVTFSQEAFSQLVDALISPNINISNLLINRIITKLEDVGEVVDGSEANQLAQRMNLLRNAVIQDTAYEDGNIMAQYRNLAISCLAERGELFQVAMAIALRKYCVNHNGADITFIHPTDGNVGEGQLDTSNQFGAYVGSDQLSFLANKFGLQIKEKLGEFGGWVKYQASENTINVFCTNPGAGDCHYELLLSENETCLYNRLVMDNGEAPFAAFVTSNLQQAFLSTKGLGLYPDR